MRRFLVATAVSAVFATIGMGAAPGAEAQAGEAATVTDIGWWTSTPGGQPEPEGGFQVAMDPQGGISSVAAIKLKVNTKTLASALFVFNEGATKVSEASADMRLCRGLSNDWSGDNANPGGLASAPKADCAKSVQLKRSGTLQSWSGDAATLISGPGTMTLMVVPGSPTNFSAPFPTYENLPHLNPPVALPVGIPPPLPVDVRGPDPLGFLFTTVDCPPGLYDVTLGLGMPQQCLGVPRLVPPTPVPALPTPPTLDLPVSVGYQIQVANTQLSAIAPDESVFSGIDDLSAGGISDSGVFETGSSVLGASSGLPLTEAGAAALGAADTGLPPTGAQLASSGEGRPWGRIWLLGLAAIAVGAGSAWARRQAQAMAS